MEDISTVSYLLFMDESGHDGSGPYEVRGGIALPAERVWEFTRKMRGIEARAFGDILARHGSEIKATKLLQRRRLRLARSRANFADEERQALCNQYLGQRRNGTEPTLEMAVAYSQASVYFVGRLLDLIKTQRGRVFCSIVPPNSQKPPTGVATGFVRKDVAFLMERFFYFLEDMDSTGILVLDETDRTDDKRFLSRLERYFSRHARGQQHANLIIPTPLFTGSDMSYPVQAADIVIYLVAQGLRFGAMTAPMRADLKPQWIDKVEGLQYDCSRTDQYGTVFTSRSIVYVPEPWRRRN